MIDEITRQSPYSVRPRYIIISLNENVTEENEIESILKDGWSKKFIDFSVIEVDLNKNLSTSLSTIIYDNSPFDERITKRFFISHNIPIFSNKLKDVNGYPMKLPIVHHPPYMELKQHQDGSIELVKSR